MTTPNELYARKPESITTDISYLVGCMYNHIQEVDNIDQHIYQIETNRIEIRFLKDWCYDGRRIWRLATVWFDNKPVMVIQNAGREGDDHEERFITDINSFRNMCTHLRELVLENTEPEEPYIHNPEADITGLVEFYGNTLDGHFERH